MANTLDPRTPVAVPFCCEECQYWDDLTEQTEEPIEGEI